MNAESVFVYTTMMIVIMKIICFILGYMTIKMGYKLIKSGVSGEFKFSAELGGLKTDLASISPGLLFVLLGVILIGYAMYVDKGVDVSRNAGQEPPEILIPNESPFENQPILKQNENDTLFKLKSNN